MSAGTELLSYLPFYDSQTKEFEQLCGAEQGVIDALWEENAGVLKESFVITAEGEGLRRLENILGLSSAGLDIKARRENIIFKLMGDTPYTMNSLYRRLKLLCKGRFELEYGEKPYTLYVGLGYLSIDQFEIIKELLYKILPANIGIVIEQVYNRHKDYVSWTHGGLSEYSHIEIREAEL